jgi:hypothetical protein
VIVAFIWGGEIEINKNICAIKLKELARAALVETGYKIAQEKMLASTHAIEGGILL